MGTPEHPDPRRAQRGTSHPRAHTPNALDSVRDLPPRGRIDRLFVVARDTGYRQRLARSLLARFSSVTCIEGRYRSLLHHVLEPADAVLFEGKPNEPRLSECVEFLRHFEPRTAVILLASRIDIHDAVRILETGADDVAFRPINFVEFPHRVAGHVRRRRLPEAKDVAFDPSALLATCRERLLTSLEPLPPDDVETTLQSWVARGETRADLCARLWELDRLFRVDRASVDFAPEPPSPLLEQMKLASTWDAVEHSLREYLATLSPVLQAPHPDRASSRHGRSPRDSRGRGDGPTYRDDTFANGA